MLGSTYLSDIRKASAPLEVSMDRKLWQQTLEAHTAFFASKGDELKLAGVRKRIADSWLRSFQMGLDPNKDLLCNRVSEKKYAEFTHVYKNLLDITEPLMRAIEGLDFSEDFVFEFVGLNGISLIQKSDLSLHPFVAEKSIFSEATMGTNAHSLCMQHKEPFQVVGPEHYCLALHSLAASAVPVMDSQGRVLGSLLLTSVLPSCPWSKHYRKLLSHTIGLMACLAAAIESKMQARQYAIRMQRLENALLQQRGPGQPGQQLSPGQPHQLQQPHQQQPVGPKDLNPSGEKPGSGDFAFRTFDDILGPSRDIKNAIYLGKRFADTQENILISGESGTGKEYFAQAIHNHCCADAPFVTVNCAAIPPRFIKRELFGCEGGSYSDVEHGAKPGKIELADRGTLLLDEIESMPLELQAALLRIIESKRVMRQGSTHYKQLDFRVIATSNRDLLELVGQGAFREDLYCRLSTLAIRLAPLRQRKDDLRFFIDFFLDECHAKDSGHKRSFLPEVYAVLMDLPWPGNVRQLKSIVYSAYYSAQGSAISLNDLPPHVLMSYTLDEKEASHGLAIQAASGLMSSSDITLSFRELETVAVKVALMRTNNNVAQAAKLLDISKATLYRKLKAQEDGS